MEFTTFLFSLPLINQDNFIFIVGIIAIKLIALITVIALKNCDSKIQVKVLRVLLAIIVITISVIYLGEI